jgi:hypothetical protein
MLALLQRRNTVVFHVQWKLPIAQGWTELNFTIAENGIPSMNGMEKTLLKNQQQLLLRLKNPAIADEESC